MFDYKGRRIKKIPVGNCFPIIFSFYIYVWSDVESILLEIDTVFPIYLISKEILLIDLYINTMKMPEPNNEEKLYLPR